MARGPICLVDTHEIVLDQVVGGPGDLDLAGHAVGLHAACGVYRIPPQVIVKLLPTDHAGDRRPGVHSETEPQLHVLTAPGLAHVRNHLQSHPCKGVGMVGTRDGHA